MQTLNIRELFYSYPGNTQDYTLDIPAFEDTEIVLTPDQKLEINGYKIDDGVCLIIAKQKLKGSAICSSCLKKFQLDFSTYPTETHFYLKPPEGVEPDLFSLINPKTFEVDIESTVNEAIFLDLPTILKCSPKCHTEHMDPNSKTASEKGLKPFSNLKDLL